MIVPGKINWEEINWEKNKMGGIPFALELFAGIKNGFPVSTSSMILNTSQFWARVLG